MANEVSSRALILLYALEDEKIIESKLKLVNRKTNGKENWIRVFRFTKNPTKKGKEGNDSTSVAPSRATARRPSPRTKHAWPGEPECGCVQDESCPEHKKQFLEGRIPYWPYNLSRIKEKTTEKPIKHVMKDCKCSCGFEMVWESADSSL